MHARICLALELELGKSKIYDSFPNTQLNISLSRYKAECPIFPPKPMIALASDIVRPQRLLEQRRYRHYQIMTSRYLWGFHNCCTSGYDQNVVRAKKFSICFRNVSMKKVIVRKHVRSEASLYERCAMICNRSCDIFYVLVCS